MSLGYSIHNLRNPVKYHYGYREETEAPPCPAPSLRKDSGQGNEDLVLEEDKNHCSEEICPKAELKRSHPSGVCGCLLLSRAAPELGGSLGVSQLEADGLLSPGASSHPGDEM